MAEILILLAGSSILNREIGGKFGCRSHQERRRYEGRRKNNSKWREGFVHMSDIYSLALSSMFSRKPFSIAEGIFTIKNVW